MVLVPESSDILCGMSSKHASRRRRQRHQRQAARAARAHRHQSTVTVVAVPVVVGLGRLTAIITTTFRYPDQPASMNGSGRLYGKIHRHPLLTRHLPLPPWALVRWRSGKYSFQMVEPVRRFGSHEEAVAAAATLTDDQPWTIVRTDHRSTKIRTRSIIEELSARGRDGRFTAADPDADDDYYDDLDDDDDVDLNDDDDLDDDDDEPPPKPKGENLRSSHPWKGGHKKTNRSSCVVSTIPPTRIPGNGVLTAAAAADRQLLQMI